MSECLSEKLLFQSNKAELFAIKLVIFIAFVTMSLPYSILPELIHANIQQLYFLKYFSPAAGILIVMSIYPLGMFLGAYLLGVLSDKIGKRSVLLISLAMTAIFQVLCGFFVGSHCLLSFIVSRFFCGLFEGNISIARAAIANICADEGTRKQQLGHANIALTLGWFVGPPLGAFLNHISLHYGLVLPFYVGAILAVAALIFAYGYFQEPPIIKASHQSKDAAISTTLCPKVLVLLAVSFLLLLGVDSFYIFIPVYLTVGLDAPPKVLATCSVIIGLSNIVSNYFFLTLLVWVVSHGFFEGHWTSEKSPTCNINFFCVEKKN